MKRGLLISIIIYCNLNITFAQAPYIQPLRNLYDTKVEMDAYYDSLRILYGGELDEEGIEYHNYLKYLAFWEPRLSPSGDFVNYFQTQKSFYDNYSYNTRATNYQANWEELGPTQKPGCLPGAVMPVGSVRSNSSLFTRAIHSICCAVQH